MIYRINNVFVSGNVGSVCTTDKTRTARTRHSEALAEESLNNLNQGSYGILRVAQDDEKLADYIVTIY